MIPAQTPSPTSTTPTLPSLPDDILIHIFTHYVHKPIALAVALASHRFRSFADIVIWRDLPLLSSDPLRAKYYQNSPPAERLVDRKFDQYLASIIRQANPARSAFVRSATIHTCSDSAARIVDFLARSSHVLQFLTIERTDLIVLPSRWASNSLEIHIDRENLTLPALRLLNVKGYGITSPNILFSLPDLAPNLETLQIDLSQWRISAEASLYPFDTSSVAPPLTLINIRNLHLHTSFHSRFGGSYNLEFARDGYNIFYPARLANYPEVRRIALDGVRRDGLTSAHEQSDFAELAALPQLEELSCNILPFDVLRALKEAGGSGFQHLKRMVLGPCYYIRLHFLLPELPQLRCLYFHHPRGPHLFGTLRPTVPYLDLADSGSAIGIHQDFAAKLRGSPLLHIIHQLPPHIGNKDDGLLVFDHLDEIEASGITDYSISSVRHAGEELLFVRAAVDTHPGWVNMTDFRRRVIPMEVLEEMRVLEGISKADWKGRGISVGRATWAVLTDWERILDEANIFHSQQLPYMTIDQGAY